jgi:RNA polymerase sigma-70 factor, ECF subfamily
VSEVELEPARDAARGDPPGSPSFADVFRETYPFAWRCLKRLGVAPGDVEDVAQEVFLVVHRKLAEFDHGSSVRAWVYGICVRKASDYRRLSRLRHEHVTERLPDRIADADQGETIDQRRALAFLDRTLGELDDDKRAVFVLYEIEGMNMSEIAPILGCHIQTAYSRLHAARKHVDAAAKREKLRRGT